MENLWNETQANSPDDDDYTTADDDGDDDLIPIESDDDELDEPLDDDVLEDAETDADDDDLDPLADRPTTFSADADFSGRSHGRTTGTMIDHEPGLPGPVGGRQ